MKAFIHIGQGKTATTAIQRFLSRHRAELKATGVLVPRSPGIGRHNLLSLYGWSDERAVASRIWDADRFDSPKEMRRWLRRAMAREIAGFGSLILSDEAIYGAGAGSVQRICQLVPGPATDHTFIVYLRRQDRHAISRYKQTLKEGKTHTLAEFLENASNLKMWDYHGRLSDILAHHPGARLSAQAFDRAVLKNGSVIEDFCARAEIPFVPDDEERLVNPSLDAFAAEYLRRRNIDHGPAPRSLLGALTRISGDVDLVMPREALDTFWARFEQSNARLVRDYIPGAADAFLSPPAERDGRTQDSIATHEIARVADRIEADLPDPG